MGVFMLKKRYSMLEDLDLSMLKDNSKDLDVVIQWLLQKDIYMPFFGKRLNAAEIRQKYERYLKPTIYDRAYIIEYDRTKIGLIEQYYIKPNDINKNKENCLVFGIKIFIGRKDYQNKKIGTMAIIKLIDIIFCKYHADYIIANILKNNKRAIKSFRKAGFVIKDSYIQKDINGVAQKYVYMQRRNINSFF